jgi:glutamyl-tRNA synthetase
MIEHFSWQRMNLTGPVFNVEKLEWLNGLYIRDMDAEELLQRVLGMVSAERLRPIVPLLRERIRRTDQFVPMAQFFLTADLDWNPAELLPKGMDAATAREGLRQLGERLDTLVPWTAAGIEERLRKFCEEVPGFSKKVVFPLVRLVVTGRTASPGLFESMEVVGKALCQDRFRRVQALLGAPATDDDGQE